jgi:hypothetical protein
MPSPHADADTERRWLRWGLVVFLAIALFFLWEEHRVHLLGVLPWLLLLACPLMHFLMHRRHRSHREEGQKEQQHAGHGCC